MDTGRAVFVAQRMVGHGPDVWSYGSGFLVGGRLVLTAAHVVADGPVRIQQGESVYDGAVLLRGSPADGTDLAILEIRDSGFQKAVPQAGLARVDRASPGLLENCWAVGFPTVKERPDLQGLRDTAHVHGAIAPAANRMSGELEFQVTSTPTFAPYAGAQESPWEAMSGAVVFWEHAQRGDLALGVVRAHPLREGPSSLAVVPLSAVATLSDADRWWELLGVFSVEDLILVPESPAAAPSAYELVVDEVARRTPELFDRDQELAALVNFACHGSGYRRLVGEPWSGKTALVSHLVKALPTTIDVVPFFISRRHGAADSTQFSAVVIEQLSALTGRTVAPPDRLEAARNALLFLWREAASWAVANRRRLVLVVDGLDEDLSAERGLPSVASMLPTFLGDHTCVLVSGRPALPEVEVDHPLRSASTPVQTLAPTSHARRLQERADDDLEALLASSPRALQASSTGTTRYDVLSLLAAAEGPLSLRDLVELTRVNGWALQRLLTTDLARVVEIGADPDHGVTFGHDTLRERATTRFDEYGALEQARERILTWAAERARAGWLRGSMPRYLVESYPGLLARVDPERLRSLLADMTYLEAAVRESGVGRVHNVLRDAVKEPGRDPRHPVLRLLSEEATLAARVLPSGLADVAVQLRNRARMLGLDDLVDQFDARLDELDVPHLRLRWRIRAESPALERSLTAGYDPVRALSVVMDGQGLVSGDGDTLRLWSVETGLQDEIGRHDSLIWSVLATPDGRRAVVKTYHQSMVIWDLEQRTKLRTLHQVSDVAMSGNGQFFAAVADKVHVFDADGHLRRTLPTNPQVTGPLLAVDHQGTILALGDSSGSMWVCTLETGKAVTHSLGAAVTALALSPDGRYLVAATADGTLHAWNPAAGTQPGTLTAETKSAAYRLCVSDAGILVTSDGGPGGIVSWDLATGRLLNQVRPEDRLSRPGIAVGAALALTPDGRLAVGGLGAEVVVMETVHHGRVRFLRGHGQVILGTAVTSDGLRAFSACEDYSINVWNLETSQPEPTFSGHNDSVSVAAVDSQSGRAATGADDGTISVWDVTSGERRYTISAHDSAVSGLAWEPTHRRLASVGLDTTLRLWDERGGARYAADLPFVADALGVMADGGVAVASYEGDVAVYRGRRLHTLRKGASRRGVVVPCHLSADGRRAILFPPEGQPGLVVFDLPDGTETRIHVEASWNQMFADSGAVLAVPRGDGIELWDVTQDLCVATLPGAGAVKRVSMTAWPGVVISGGWDRTIRAWAPQLDQTSSEVPLQTAWSCDDEVTVLAISTEGTTVVAGTNSGAVLCLELRLSPSLSSRQPGPRTTSQR